MLRRWLALSVVLGIAGIVVLSGTEFFGEHGIAYVPAGLYAAQGDPDAGLQQQFAVDHGKRGDVFRIAWNGGPSYGGRLRKGGVTVT